MSLATQPDVLVAKLVLDFLRTGASQEALGEAAALPLRLMDHGGKISQPAVIIHAAEANESSDGRRLVNVAPVVFAKLQPSDEEAAASEGALTREESAAVLRAYNLRLADLEAFEEWLGELEADRLEGWTLLDLPRKGVDVVVRPQGEQAPDDYQYGLGWVWRIAVI